MWAYFIILKFIHKVNRKHCPSREEKHPRASPGCSATYAGSVICLDTVLREECFHVLEHIHKDSFFGGVAVGEQSKELCILCVL